MSSECFVYVTLPGSLNAVIAGRFSSLIGSNGNPVGEFSYARSYLSRPDRVPLDPVELGELRLGIFRTEKLDGVFGAIRDAAPDSWGRKFIDKSLGFLGSSEVDYLLNSPDDRAGALSFGFNQNPPAPVRAFNKTLDLSRLRKLADDVIAAENDTNASKPTGHEARQVATFLRAGTSMGGARPKTTVEHEGSLWLAKFSRPDDKWNNPRVEHAMMSLARTCGLNCAETQIEIVGDTEVVLVKRFDRQNGLSGYSRSRMISALTMLGAEERSNRRWSYLDLAETMTRLGMQHNLPELFRRMCLNCLISNLDDHPRNHAYVAASQDWTLSPAYDLTPSPVVAIERRNLAMTLGDGGRYANKNNLLSQCRRFRITHDEAEFLIDTMAEQVRFSWYRIARQVGVTERDCSLIASAFDYEGFNYDLPQTGPGPEPLRFAP